MTTVFIHGLGQGPESWDPVTAALGGADGSLRPDLSRLLAEGGSPSYPALYRAFSGWCRPLPEPLALCGLSLGAVLALHYALDHPERVGALALIAPQYQMPQGLLRFQGLLFRVMPESAFAGAGLGKHEMIALTASMADLDFSARLGELACPPLVICGERDRANQKAARELAAKAPGGELRLVPGAGHEVNREAPEALAAILRDSGFFRAAGL